MARGDAPVSPWVWQAQDANGKTLSLTIAFDNTTGALLSGSAVRQTGCLYGHMYFGVGADGSPNSSAKKFTIPAGTTNVTAAQLLSVAGLSTISDVNALQFTVGP